MPWRPRPDGLEVRVRVTPRGGRDAIEGIDIMADGQRVLKVRVRAVPEDGAANEAVRRLLAKALRLPASAVRLEAGATARLKTFVVEGDAQDLTTRLAAMTGSKT
ncbi:DUF167 family protein [Microvirga brassicacearum]|uniref:UPF0235 protein FEZ63_21760 n=1 Tax=Microvirga brassicacearum TaxID=2580413 RepID=A0A5N3P4L5_9HYPH|nr:DUF167 family protein [Microvirga brassicacearum]KAB0264680.1 hypothetical protein FEZ63_21760 [Microvirga brassicacearum]